MKKNLMKLTALLLSATCGICAMSIPKTVVAKGAKASIEVKKFNLEPGDRTKIRLKNKLKGATYKFKSSKKTVVKVNQKGFVKALDTGVAKITVKEINGSKKTKVGTVKITVQDPIALDNFRNSTAAFSVNLFKETCLKDIKDGKNALVSPESVISALMLLTDGCKGDTFDELESTIAGTMKYTDYRDGFCAFNDKLTSSKDVKFHLANSIWVKDDAKYITLDEDYVANVKNYYNAGIFPRKFDASTADEINKWVSDNTDSMIPEIIKELSPDTAAVLVNALCFEGKWADQYSGTVKDEFTNAQGKKEEAQMLYGSENRYLSDDNAVGFVKYYEGREYAFMAILPNENVGVEEYVKNMTGKTITDLYDTATYEKVNTKMPEFSYDYDVELNTPLENMGIKKAFDPFGADLTGMGSTGFDNLFVDSVLHKTHIELDKNGTKAAAATAVIVNVTTSVGPTEPPKEVYLDRPFIYAIVEAETGLPVFIGVVNTLSK